MCGEQLREGRRRGLVVALYVVEFGEIKARFEGAWAQLFRLLEAFARLPVVLHARINAAAGILHDRAAGLDLLGIAEPDQSQLVLLSGGKLSHVRQRIAELLVLRGGLRVLR